MLDVVMLAYGEPNADENFKRIQKLAPHAKRVDNVVGILEAHQAAAQLATTDNFYVVDADAVLSDHFDFSFTPDIIRESYPGVNESSCVFVWQSVNAVNGLIYGYGGVKLFPRHKLLKAKSFQIDMTTTIDAPLVVKQQISNISEFNTDDFSTWRSAFRECVKLSSNTNPDIDDRYRLDVWCSRGDSNAYGKYAIMGARQGREFGAFYKDDKNNLDKINDYDWLKSIFSNSSTNTLDQHYPIHLSWFHGLEEYFTLKQAHLEEFIKIKNALVYGDNWSIRDLILEEVSIGKYEDTERYVNVILQSLLIDDYVIPDHDVLAYISRHIDDDFINGLVNVTDPSHANIDLVDYITRDSMTGKSWMMEELSKTTLEPSDVVILGGNICTHLSMLINNYETIESIISVDIDHKTTEYARLLNYIAESNELFSAINNDVSDIIWDEDSLPDLLINTSCAHMDDTWFENIPDNDDTLIVIQTNDCADNINCVRDLSEALTKYNLKEVLFSGEQSTQLYNRFMIIGTK
jgi:hypothetical protein